MDNNTLLISIAGTILAFVTSFFAEPIKICFQKRAKTKSIRTAIYKELLFNYVVVERWLSIEQSMSKGGALKETLRTYSEYAIRTECYQDALRTELGIFYGLKEASAFNTIYSTLSLITKMSLEGLEPYTARELALVNKNVLAYLRAVELFIHAGEIDEKVIREVEEKEFAEGLLARAREFPVSGSKLPEEAGTPANRSES
jgi:hypothetical protein